MKSHQNPALTQLASGCYDNHCHVFRSDLPMITPRRYTPDYDALPEQLCRLLLQHGLDGALLVQPSFLGCDNSYLLETLARQIEFSTLTLKGVVVLDPAATPDKATLTRMEQLGVIGVRLNFLQRSHTFDYRDWKNLLTLAEDRDWHIELHCESHALPQILPSLARHHSNIVLDHYGLITNVNHCSGIKTILQQPPDKLWIKASAPYRLNYRGDDKAANCHVSQLRQLFADHIGTKRLLWGSDWPFTQYEKVTSYNDMFARFSSTEF